MAEQTPCGRFSTGIPRLRKKIETILAQLQHNFPNLPITGTMSQDSLLSFVNNVYVIRTGKSEEQIEAMYQSLKRDARLARERRDLMTPAFFEALAAIVKDEPVMLANDNPYKRYIIALVESIEVWKSQQS